MTEVTFKEALKLFITEEKASNLSPATIQSYKDNADYFINFYGNESLCCNITDKTVNEYKCYLQEKKNLSDVIIQTYIRNLRVILYFFMKKGYTETFQIFLPKAKKHFKELYTDEEIDRLTEKPSYKDITFVEFRDWAITCFLLGTGVRLNTLWQIEIKDIDFNYNRIYLRYVKARDAYYIPMQGILSSVLKEYLSVRLNNSEIPDKYLFCKETGAPLTPSAIQSAIDRYNAKRKVSKSSIHLYRHTFGTTWIREGGDLTTLQYILGHSSIEVTSIYVQMSGQMAEQKYMACNPLDRSATRKHKDSPPTTAKIKTQGLKRTRRAYTLVF